MTAPQPSKRNRRERHVVEWLTTRIGNRLADRNGAIHPPPWEPRSNVVIGVLEPIRLPAPAPAEAGTDAEASDGADEVSAGEPVAYTLQVPDGTEVPSMSLDFLVEVPPGTDNVQVRLDASWSIYTELVASLDDQRKYLGDGSTAEDAPPGGGGAEAGPAAELAGAAAAAPSGPGVEKTPKGGQQELDGANPVSAFKATDVSRTAATAAAGKEVKTRKKRERKARLLGAWQRHRLQVESFTLTIPLDGNVVEEQQALFDAVQPIIDAHYQRPDAMRPLESKRNELPREALADAATFANAVANLVNKTWQHSYPDLRLSCFAQQVGPGRYLVSVALRNMTLQQGGTKAAQDFAAYDCAFSAIPQGAAQLRPQHFELAPRDYRLTDLADIVGRGAACVAVEHDGGVRSETLPVFAQPIIDPREEHVLPPRWDELAQDPRAILDSIESAMQAYLEDFRDAVAASSPSIRPAVQRDCKAFEDELRRFRLGRRCLTRDPRLMQSFRLANETFAITNTGKSFATWRLFQLVYIVTHLPALAARESDDPELRAELDFVDVLWFPAGGGKTEAYLGLILTALFYDRLRGKQLGVSAWLRFPLRMLSVQQLFRTLRVLVVAERLRTERGVGAAGDDPFALGYLVGGKNTPNGLKFEDGWWRGWDVEKAKAANGTFTLDHEEHRLITRCPYCQADKVELRLDEASVQLLHVCAACDKTLPLHMSDEEVYRYLPSVVISTVDKLTGYTWFPEFTSFTHGPAHRCAQHGYYSFPVGGTCLVGKDICPPSKTGHPVAAACKDPVPALTIQDEMHLLKEELGAFGAHYEGLIAELQRTTGPGLPTKVLTASATIEQYEDQLRQVYGRRPRAFPSPGWKRELSFYTRTTPNTRRLFLGVLPHYRRKADIAAIIQADFVRAVAEAQDDANPNALLGIDPGVWDKAPSRQESMDLLFDYEVSLGYVNSKAHGSRISEELASLSDEMRYAGLDAVQREVLTGQVSIPELADAINRVQEQTLAVPRERRLRALVGTSVVSHGVDLDRLNAMTLAGMPTTAADYIQVTARAGRTHVGLVVTVFDAFSRRERSLFSNFLSYHAFLDRMVTPVPVNKYAFFVAERTLPGIVLAMLHDLARDAGLRPPKEGARTVKAFQAWWNSERAHIDAALLARLRNCFATPIAGVNDKAMEDELVERVLARWKDIERPRLHRSAEERLTSSLFANEPLANFRQIDKASEFQVRARSTATPSPRFWTVLLSSPGSSDLAPTATETAADAGVQEPDPVLIPARRGVPPRGRRVRPGRRRGGRPAADPQRGGRVPGDRRLHQPVGGGAPTGSPASDRGQGQGVPAGLAGARALRPVPARARVRLAGLRARAQLHQRRGPRPVAAVQALPKPSAATALLQRAQLRARQAHVRREVQQSRVRRHHLSEHRQLQLRHLEVRRAWLQRGGGVSHQPVAVQLQELSGSRPRCTNARPHARRLARLQAALHRPRQHRRASLPRLPGPHTSGLDRGWALHRNRARHRSWAAGGRARLRRQADER